MEEKQQVSKAKEILQLISDYELLQTESKNIKIVAQQETIVKANLTLLRWIKNIDKGKRKEKQKEAIRNDLNTLQQMCTLCGELEMQNYSLQRRVIYLENKSSSSLEIENRILKEGIHNLMLELEKK